MKRIILCPNEDAALRRHHHLNLKVNNNKISSKTKKQKKISKPKSKGTPLPEALEWATFCARNVNSS
jgi:hypothetical protein